MLTLVMRRTKSLESTSKCG